MTIKSESINNIFHYFMLKLTKLRNIIKTLLYYLKQNIFYFPLLLVSWSMTTIISMAIEPDGAMDMCITINS